MKFYYNKKDKVTIDFTSDELRIEKDPYDCESYKERLSAINKIRDDVFRLCDNDQKELLHDFNLSWVVNRKHKQITFLRKSNLVELPIGTILYHASNNIESIRAKGLKSTDVSNDNVLYNEQRIYFALSPEVIQMDTYLNNRETISFEYTGKYKLFNDNEFDSGAVFAANDKEFVISL